MHLRWRGLDLPANVQPDLKSRSATFARFVAEPFEPGFGTTIGNSLRRVLLSSLEGAAVTGVTPTSAASNADAPGTGTTGTSAAIAARTSRPPGSDTRGVPASVMSATDAPPASSFIVLATTPGASRNTSNSHRPERANGILSRQRNGSSAASQ